MALLIVLIIFVSSLHVMCGQEITMTSHNTSREPEEEKEEEDREEAGRIDNSAPHGLNDKIHSPAYNISSHEDGVHSTHHYLIPPFILGASVVIIVYIICNCAYLHCYARKKLKRLAEKHLAGPAVLVGDESTISSGAYQAFTPIPYGSDGQDGEFLYYQAHNDNEWETSVDESSTKRSSTKSSTKSSPKSRSSSSKRSILSQGLFRKKRNYSSTSSAPEEQSSSTCTDGTPKPGDICLVPVVARSRSVPEKDMPAAAVAEAPSRRMILAPIRLPRVQSLKTAAAGSRGVKTSASDASVPQHAPVLIFGKGGGFSGKVFFRQTSMPTELLSRSNDAEAESRGSPPAVEKTEDTNVTFHLNEEADALGDIHEDNEEKS